MKVSLAKSSEAMNKRHRVKRRWYKALCGMAAVVVFWTTYALVLPAITMTEEYHCGKEEHTHDASCYTGGAVYTSVCTAEADSAGYILIHSHSELCYDPAGALVCTLPEVGTHQHTDACYLTATHPACGLEESQAHTHTEACFRQQDVLICGMEETAGHSHTAQCYDEAGALICAEAESQAHAHTAECHAQESVQICGMEERAGHLHSEECGSVEERSLVCGQTELIPHTHTDTCYSGGALTCGLPEAIEHTHTEACFAKTGSDEEKVLTCTKEEHTHELIKNSDSDEFEYSDTVTVTVTKTDSDADGVTVIFYNSPGTELPKTGGSAAAMYALGGLLTALAVCRYAHRKRRERRGEA